MDLSYKPVVLYEASLERMEEARRAFEAEDHVLAAYIAGVAVECILQAIALQFGAAHDARHVLERWLDKCPATLQDAIRDDAFEQWSTFVALWDNTLRYLAHAGFLGYIRRKEANRGIKGGPDAIVRAVARQIVDAATIIHAKGVGQWDSSIRKS